MRAKPIVPGCMAIVLRAVESYAEIIGKIVTVISKNDKGRWLIDYRFPHDPNAEVLAPESYLMRIDDPDQQALIESEHKLEQKNVAYKKKAVDRDDQLP